MKHENTAQSIANIIGKLTQYRNFDLSIVFIYMIVIFYYFYLPQNKKNSTADLLTKIRDYFGSFRFVVKY